MRSGLLGILLASTVTVMFLMLKAPHLEVSSLPAWSVFGPRSHVPMPERQQPKRQRRDGQDKTRGQNRDSTIQRLLCAHDAAIEKLRAALTIFLFVPKAINDSVEEAAKSWKSKNEVGKPHPDGCSCTTARLRALLDGIHTLMGGDQPVLTASAEVKAALTALVEVVRVGRADHVVSDITLRIAQSRTADQSPYEITVASTAEGQSFRTSLFGITQPGAPETNSREVPLKSWEVRPYRPNRRGTLVRELTGGR